MCGNADAEVFRHGLCVSGGTSVSSGQLCGRTEPSRVLRLGWAGPGHPCSMLVPALGVGDEGSMGRRNADRVPRVGFLRGGPPGSIRMATYETCGHEAPLPLRQSSRGTGNIPLEWALYGLRCLSCGSAGVHIRTARLCMASCPRFPHDPGDDA